MNPPPYKIPDYGTAVMLSKRKTAYLKKIYVLLKINRYWKYSAAGEL